MSGIGGLRPLEGVEHSAEENLAALVTAEGKPVEGAIVRGGAPPALATLVSALGAKGLEKELKLGGLGSAEAKQEAKEVTAKAGEVRDLEAQLKFWEDYRDSLKKCLDDP